MKPLKIFFLLPLLGGCTSSQETFDCPAGSGVGCKSIVEVNEMINQGEMEKGKTSSKNLIITPPLKGKDVVRHPEIPLRVFIAGFEDDDGNFHEGGYIHTILKRASWGTHA